LRHDRVVFSENYFIEGVLYLIVASIPIKEDETMIRKILPAVLFFSLILYTSNLDAVINYEIANSFAMS
jgi:hypothetical protein